MGITISSHKHSIDMGAGGFASLRTTISKLLNCKDFADLYEDLSNMGHIRYIEKGFDSMEEYFEDHDKRVLEICEREKLDEEVVNFLYRSDCDCDSVSVKTCRHLWKFIKDYDDDYVYGYAGRPDRAMFKDFKQIVKECAEDRRVMRIS
jgi:hypothetical protein